MSTVFEAYITNLGKYAEGQLVGETLKFPATTEEVQSLLKNIGVDGVRYEEFFITAFDGDVMGLYDYLTEYENLDELNHLAHLISELDSDEIETLEAVLNKGDHTSSVADIINLVHNLDCYDLHPGVTDDETLGRIYVEDMELLDVPDNVLPYFDFEAYGRDIVLEQSGALSLAYVLGVLLFVFDLFGPLKALYGEASRLTVMNAALDRIEAVLDEPELSDNGKQHIPAQAQPGQPEVLFNDVTFAYQDKEVLHHISFAMKKNSMTALVGPSGSGKSTIANLLARLWDVKSGNVTIRGVDIRNVPLSELMDQISMVFQRVYLFQDTIYNNIIMGKPDATEEEVYEAARKARCYDFIMALPDGFQTVVGEGGATLSGGEKQRISIARCILKDAPIVILDEATASVDTDNESYIQEAISELVKGKTLLVIAHRLNTICQADQILVIADGRISEQGTHDELIAKAGIYQDFVNIRKKSSSWSLA